MNIYIPLEVKVRELEGKTLLAMAAAERGHVVILGDKSATRTLARDGILPPGLIHNKSVTPSDATLEMFDRFQEHGHLVSAQDEESGLLDESYDGFAQLRFSEEALSRVDCFCAWGRHDADSLKRIYPACADRIRPTGSPRVDFWRKKFAGYYDVNGSRRRNGQRPLILIASNFSSLLDENRIWNRIARLRESGYFDRDPEWERFIYDNASYQLKLVYEFVEMVRNLSKDFPEVDILVRPHPVESIESWKKLIGDYNNIYVNRDGSISGWIQQSALLLHNGCTSALEAAVGGLVRIAYRPLPDELEREIPNRISYQAFSYKDLKGMVGKHLAGEELDDKAKVEKLTRELLENRFANLDDPLAADRIVSAWEEHEKAAGLRQSSVEELIKLSSVRRGGNWSSSIKKPLVKLKERFTRKGAGKSDSDGKLLQTSHKFPSFTEEELSGMISSLQKTLNRFHNIEYRRVGEKSYILYHKS